ncbi:MAG TPA: urease subunit gamma [Nitrososphaeraceae archaeon]|nr:urease subunit gamma [Nitrososphaeraceae archaeon]
MILVRVTVIGEEGASPFPQVFEYSNESFDKIFSPTIDRIKEKLKQRLRISLYECLALYCDYMVSRLRTKNDTSSIEQGIRALLSHHDVMTGVPETLRKIVFQMELNRGEQEIITISEPIRIPHYVLGTTY